MPQADNHPPANALSQRYVLQQSRFQSDTFPASLQIYDIDRTITCPTLKGGEQSVDALLLAGYRKTKQ